MVAALLDVGLAVLPYFAGPDAHLPDLEEIPVRPGDVVLRVNQFGLQTLDPLRNIRRPGVDFIDDHTHDPWSYSAWHSDADWCFASLRKTLPVADGAVLWSPRSHPLPQEPELTTERQLASLRKLAGMLLKDRYLEGVGVEKAFFRLLAVEGEQGIGEGAPSAMTPWSSAMVARMPTEAWRITRRRNHGTLSGALAEIPSLRVLPPLREDLGCPFMVVVLFDCPGRRDTVRRHLLNARIYPGAHWALDPPAIQGIPTEHQNLSRRILTLSCDMRYGTADLLQVGAAVRRAAQAGAGL